MTQLIHDPEHDNDFALLQRYRASRDEQAFAQIVQRYSGAVYAACFRVLGDRASAEDAAQETFLRLVRNPESVKTSVGGWLHRAATTISIDAARRFTSQRKRDQAYQPPEATHAREASGWHELSPVIDEALTELPSDLQSLLVDHFIAGKSQRELAQTHLLSPATLSRRMRLALDMLREKLRSKGVVIGAASLSAMLLSNAAEAAPLTLTAELGKLAMVSGATARAVGWGKLIGWGVAVSVIAGAAVFIAVQLSPIFWPIFDPTPTAPPAKTQAGAPGKAEDEPSRQPPYITMPSPSGELDGTRVATFQNPAAAVGGKIWVTYEDSRTVQMDVGEATRLIERQARKPMAELIRGQNAQPKAAGR